MKNLIGLFIIVAALALACVVFFSSKSPATPERPRTHEIPLSVYRGVNPGVATEEDVIKTLGEPARKDVAPAGGALVYVSEVGDRPITVDLNTYKTVTKIVEPVGPQVRFSDVINNFGRADLLLYGLLAKDGYILYVYPGRGAAFLANPVTLAVHQRWYFAPTDRAMFMATLATGYFEQYDAGQQ